MLIQKTQARLPMGEKQFVMPFSLEVSNSCDYTHNFLKIPNKYYAQFCTCAVAALIVVIVQVIMTNALLGIKWDSAAPWCYPTLLRWPSVSSTAS